MIEKAHMPTNNTTPEVSGSLSNPDLTHVAQADVTADHSDVVTAGILDDFSSQVVAIYENLLEQESAPADPYEIIPLG